MADVPDQLSPAGEGRVVMQDRENRMLMKINERRMFPECFVLCSPAASSLYTWEPEREALATIPLEWHYLMVGWALSAESGLRMGGGTTGSRPWCDPVPSTNQTPRAAKTNTAGQGGGGHDRDNEIRKFLE